MLVTLAQLFLSCWFSIDVARANFFASPAPKWSIQLLGSGRTSGRGLRKGNGIVSVKDGSKIVVTANDGSLHIIQTTNQVKSHAVYVPDGSVGSRIECLSGAIIVYEDQQDKLYFPIGDEEEKIVSTKEDFIVYALIDNAEANNDGNVGSIVTGDVVRGAGTTSRVIAVNMEGTLKWSVSVPGRIEGTPVVGKTGIYVTHNVNSYGALSILRLQPNDGKAAIAATVNTLSDERSEPIPLGPPTLRKPASWDDEGTFEDVIIVTGFWENGFSETEGGIFMLSSFVTALPTVSDDFKLVQISSWSLSASAPPMVYGESIFVAAAGGNIGGFTGDKKNDLSGIVSGKEKDISPRWDYQVSPNPTDSSQPIRSQPVSDLEGDYLFVTGVDNDLYCLQSDNGKEVWKVKEGSQIMARPHVFEAVDWRKVVYVIESENGRVRQYDLYSGRRYWDYSCADISNQFCQDPVEAEFAITPSGNTIYYGDIYGRIHSLDVANFETESPTMIPTSVPTANPSAQPTLTLVPTRAEQPTQMPQEEQETPSPTNDTGTSVEVILIDGDIDHQSSEEKRDGYNDSEGFAEGNEGNSTVAAASLDQQASSNDSDKIAVYVGAAIAGLCVLMIPIVLFSILRRRKKASSGSEMVVEIIDDCSSCDLESQSDLDYFNSIETNNSCDPNDGDGIEVEIIQHGTTRGNQTKKKKVKRKKGSLPDTPNTVNSLESIEETPEGPSTIVVVEDEFNVADPSVEAVNLRQTFDKVVDSQAVAHAEQNVDDSNYLSEDDIPPPPPSGEESPTSSSKDWTWSSLLQIGTVQSSKSVENSSEISLKNAIDNSETKHSSHATSPSPDTSSTEEPTVGRNEISSDKLPSVQKESFLPIKKMKWRKKAKKNSTSLLPEPLKDSPANDHHDIRPKIVQSEQSKESQTSSMEELKVENDAVESPFQNSQREQFEESLKEGTRESVANAGEKEKKNEKLTKSVTSPPQTSTSPSTYSMLSDALHSLSPVRSNQSVQESLLSSPNQSSTKSVGSDDESLYTSYTSGTHEKKKDVKDLSPLSNYVYNQDVHRRGRSEIANEGKDFLAQPVLSKSHATIGEDEHPDDERSTAPENQKYGKSVRSKRDSNSFKSTNSTGNEFSHTPLAEMYDQLAAIGQQRREERKPGFKRRNKKLEQEGLVPQQGEQGQDTWGSFLNELAEAEEQFFKPRSSQGLSLSTDSDDAELTRINDVDNK